MYYKKIYLPNGEEKLISCEDLEARYDSEGNEISSFYLPRDEAEETYLTQADAEDTYLPLSAGEDKPLTDDLYIVKGNSKIKVFIDSDGAKFSYINNGSEKGGICISPGGYVNIYSNTGMPIMFRPHGLNDDTGMVYVNSSGQFVGGTKIQNYWKNVTVSAASTSYVQVQRVQLSAGAWDIGNYMDLNVSHSGIYNNRIVVGDIDKTVRASASSGGGSYNGCKLNLSASAYVTTYAYVPAACTIRTVLYTARLG